MLMLERKQVIPALDTAIRTGKAVLLWVDTLFNRNEGAYVQVDAGALRQTILNRQGQEDGKIERAVSEDFEMQLRDDGVLLIHC